MIQSKQMVQIKEIKMVQRNNNYNLIYLSNILILNRTNIHVKLTFTFK